MNKRQKMLLPDDPLVRRRGRSHWGQALPILVAFVWIVLAPQVSMGAPPPVYKIPFAEHHDGAYTVPVDRRSADWTLYLLDATTGLSDLAGLSSSCRIDVAADATQVVVNASSLEGDDCDSFLHAYSATEFLLFSEGWSREVLLELPKFSLDMSLKVPTGVDGKVTALPQLPRQVSVGDETYRFVGTKGWTSSQIPVGNATRVLPQAVDKFVRDLIEAGKSDVPVLIDMSDEGWARIKYSKVEKDDGPAFGDAEFEAACAEKVAEEAERRPSPLPKLLAAKGGARHRRLALSRDWYYVVCINYTSPHRPRRLVHTSISNADPEASRGHIYANQDVIVHTFHADGVSVAVDMTISPGPISILYDATATTKEREERVAQPASSRRELQARGVNGRGVLTITGRRDKDDLPVASFPVESERAYRGALRIGVAGFWAPAQREYAIRTTTSGVNEIYVKDGANRGLQGIDVTLGYSVFLPPIRHDHLDVSFGLFGGIALAEATSKDIRLLSAVYFAPEINFGKAFSIAPAFSLRRGQRLQEAYRVGQTVSRTDESITRLSIEPAIGFIINLSPRFWRAVRG